MVSFIRLQARTCSKSESSRRLSGGGNASGRESARIELVIISSPLPLLQVGSSEFGTAAAAAARKPAA